MELRKYGNRLQNKLGETKSADRIVEESWWAKVVKELNQMSLECVRDLQGEIGQRWDKGSYQIDLEEAPPTRLLALSVVINYWLGWVGNEKGLNSPPISAWQRIQDAYQAGKELSEKGEVP